MKSDPFFYPDIKEDEVLDLNVCINYDFSVPHSAFDTLVLKTSKLDIISKVKVPFKLTHVVLIIAVHLALVAAVNLSIDGLERSPPPHKKPLLKATLYFKKPIRVNSLEKKPIIEKNTVTKVKPTDVTKSELPKTKIPINKVHKEFSKAINKNIVSSIKPPKNKDVLYGQSLADQSLSKLRSSINEQAVHRASNESYNKYLSDKNSVDKSINKFHPDATNIQEIKIKSTNVDCNSGVKRNIVLLSGLMGGRIKCYSSPNLKNFLKSRNKY